MPIYPYSFQLPPLNVQDIPNDGVAGEFLGINGSGALDWLPAGGGGSGDMLAANNLSELTNFATARTNIGLGTASTPTFANLTLTSPILTASAPVTISQTWGTTGTYTAFKVVATETLGAASASNLLELWSGATPELKFYVSKGGNLSFRAGANFGSISTDGTGRVLINSTNSAGARVTGDLHIGSNDIILLRDGAANTLALRNGTNAQTFNVYGTWSSITDYRRLTISCDNTTGAVTIATNKGSGTTNSGAANLILESSNVSGLYSRLLVRSGSRPMMQDGSGNLYLPNITTIGISSRETIGGSFHSFLGFQVLESLTSGNENVAMGMRALAGSTTANRNISIGTESGKFIADGTNNTLCDNSVFLGYDTRAALSGQTNQIVIGHTAVGIGSNSVVLGNDSITKTALKGNVGIGTTAPQSKLDVNGDTRAGGSFVVDRTAGTLTNYFQFRARGAGEASNFGNPVGNGAGEILADGLSGLIIGTKNSTPLVLATTSAERLRIDPSGNVGIGTTSPTSKLEVVESTSNVSAFIVRATSVAAPRLEIIDGSATPNKWLLGCGSGTTIDGKFFIFDAKASLTRLLIDTSGNIGIGTGSPTSKLQVANGDVEVDTISKGIILKSPDGTRYRVTVANGGTLSVAAA